MTHTQPRFLKKFAALIAIPFMLLLAGCGKLEATVNIENPEKVTLEGVATMKKSALDQAGVSTDAFCGEEALEEFAKNTEPELKMEEKGDEVVCTFSTIAERKKPMGDALTYDKESDTYTYHEDSKGAFGDQAAASGFKVDVTFVFPGKVLESSLGKIDGNKVHVTDTKEYFSDITIKAEGSSFPWLTVIIVVVVVLLLILAAVVIGAIVLMKRKNKAGAGQADFSQQGFNQGPAQGSFQNQGQQGFNQGSQGAQQGFGQHPSQCSANDLQQQGSYEAPRQSSYEAPQQGDFQPPQPGQQSQSFQGQPYGEPGNRGPQGGQDQTFGKQ